MFGGKGFFKLKFLIDTKMNEYRVMRIANEY